uniref:5'-nucleotidase, cytosolic IA n=1 Tax=Phasianus colchicus TaxID=9054 RepID=A0A669R0L9_PHACC
MSDASNMQPHHLTPPSQGSSIVFPQPFFALTLQKDPSEALVIAVTTRAIFDLEEEHQLYLEKGKEEYARHQQANQDKPLPPGTAFAFIQAAQYVNKKILESNPAEKGLFDILVLSNNSPESGVRIINSAKHYDALQCGISHVFHKPILLHLTGVSAALVFQQEVQAPSTLLRVAFDGDAVLFSDETDQIFREQGLEGAITNPYGFPLGKSRLNRLGRCLRLSYAFSGVLESPIRTYLVTARSGRDMGIRAIKTLREWGLAIDEAFFMDGAPKGPILAQIQPHIFFDDGLHNIQGAQDVGVPSAWVPSCC